MLAGVSPTGVGGRGRGGSVGNSVPFIVGRDLTGKTGLRGIVFCRKIPGLAGSGGTSSSPSLGGEGGGTGRRGKDGALSRRGICSGRQVEYGPSRPSVAADNAGESGSGQLM